MMTRGQIGELDALAQELYKRTVEWWVDSLQNDPKRVSSKRSAIKKLVDRIYARLVSTVGVAEAGWFRRSKAYEPIRDRVAECSDANWINEAWHRKDRLEQILVRQERLHHKAEEPVPQILPPGLTPAPKRRRR